MTPPLFDDATGFRDALQAWLDAAIQRGARQLHWVDPDFSHWPLDDAALLDSLAAWLRLPGRRLTMLAASFDTLERSRPRFAAWRRDWMHAIDAREPGDEDAALLPALAVDDGPCLLNLLRHEPPRGRWQQDAAAARQARELFDAAMQHSSPAWPARPLGL